MRSTVIAHFYNEEYLLPWWLRHHTAIFDHGVLIDYSSTDRSVEICRELAPGWEVMSSSNDDFDAAACDREVMELESQLDGWKMALNITEFLCCSDWDGFLAGLESTGAPGVFVQGIVMVDPPEVADVPLEPSKSLMTQRYHGYVENEAVSKPKRSRLIHRRPYGAYTMGRHDSWMRGVQRDPPGVFIAWFGFSPWTVEFRDRKLQIRPRMSDRDKFNGAGQQHMVDVDGLDARWSLEVARAVDLRDHAEFQRAVLATTALPARRFDTPIREVPAARPAPQTRRIRRDMTASDRLLLAYESAAEGRWREARKHGLAAIPGPPAVRARGIAMAVSPRRGSRM